MKINGVESIIPGDISSIIIPRRVKNLISLLKTLPEDEVYIVSHIARFMRKSIDSVEGSTILPFLSPYIFVYERVRYYGCKKAIAKLKKKVTGRICQK